MVLVPFREWFCLLGEGRDKRDACDGVTTHFTDTAADTAIALKRCDAETGRLPLGRKRLQVLHRRKAMSVELANVGPCLDALKMLKLDGEKLFVGFSVLTNFPNFDHLQSTDPVPHGFAFCPRFLPAEIGIPNWNTEQALKHMKVRQ